MGTLAFGSILSGIVLGQFFKWYILVPASGLAMVLVLFYPAVPEHSLISWLLRSGVAITSIEIGYLLGAAVRFFIDELKHSRNQATGSIR